jgi:UDP-N-acetylglucosamine acyltransferase
MQIHPTAIVSDKAKLASGVQVGPYAVIGDNVEIGSGTRIGSHAVVDGHTVIGKECEIFTGAVVGSRPQDLKYKDEKVFLRIGDRNIIREYCTLNPGTGEGGETLVGSGNLFMAYSHVAHDCRVGNGCVFANNGTLAGHVTVEDKAVVGGMTAIHQFVHIGKLSIIGGCSKVVQDIPPFSTCDGHPAVVFGLNLIGLRRNGLPKEAIRALDQAYRILFNSGSTIKHAVEEVEKSVPMCEEVSYLLGFIKRTERGISKSCRSKE